MTSTYDRLKSEKASRPKLPCRPKLPPPYPAKHKARGESTMHGHKALGTDTKHEALTKSTRHGHKALGTDTKH